jgi:hypothetical protein
MAKKKETKNKKEININLSYDDELENACNPKKWSKHVCCKTSSGCGGAFYFLGFLGAAIYYISTATGFWVGVLGVLKALVWPAFLVFELLMFLGL